MVTVSGARVAAALQEMGQLIQNPGAAGHKAAGHKVWGLVFLFKVSETTLELQMLMQCSAKNGWSAVNGPSVLSCLSFPSLISSFYQV